MGLDALLEKLESRVSPPDQTGSKGRGHDQEQEQSGKRQIGCRAFGITKILMATKAEHCLDRQGGHCGECPLRVPVQS